MPAGSVLDHSEVRLHGGAQAPREARSIFDGLCEEIEEPLRATVKLLVSEVVTNRLERSGCGSIGLRVRIGRDRIRVAVSEHGHRADDANSTQEDSNLASEWGLYLLEGLADRWDVDDGDEPRVWFEIDRGVPESHPIH
jgi:anti-sigma regulatory factor (Ser/Thr protein kinase)